MLRVSSVNDGEVIFIGIWRWEWIRFVSSGIVSYSVVKRFFDVVISIGEAVGEVTRR